MNICSFEGPNFVKALGMSYIGNLVQIICKALASDSSKKVLHFSIDRVLVSVTR